jgi:hypothetical protein
MKPGKDFLYLVIMSWLVFTTLVMPQLLLTRCLIQPSYRWSNAGFSGTGTGKYPSPHGSTIPIARIPK